MKRSIVLLACLLTLDIASKQIAAQNFALRGGVWSESTTLLGQNAKLGYTYMVNSGLSWGRQSPIDATMAQAIGVLITAGFLLATLRFVKSSPGLIVVGIACLMGAVSNLIDFWLVGGGTDPFGVWYGNARVFFNLADVYIYLGLLIYGSTLIIGILRQLYEVSLSMRSEQYANI